MKTLNATDLGRDIFLKAIDFKLIMNVDKVSLKFSVCGHDYLVDLDANLLKDPKGAHQAWINVFEEFEKDLDAGVQSRSSKLIL